MGVATNWRFSGFAMGSFPTGRPLSRVMPKGNVSLWVTGTMGDANWAALAESPTPSFELRLKESRVIAQKACACMDTSGGFLEAVWCFHLLNPEFRFDVSLDLVPLAVGVSKEAEKRGVPWESFLLGGAGEYELFFALSEPVSSETREAMKAVGAVFVGVAQPNAENAGVFLRSDGNRVCRMESGPPCPREMGEREAYVKKVIEMAKQLRGKK